MQDWKREDERAHRREIEREKEEELIRATWRSSSSSSPAARNYPSDTRFQSLNDVVVTRRLSFMSSFDPDRVSKSASVSPTSSPPASPPLRPAVAPSPPLLSLSVSPPVSSLSSSHFHGTSSHPTKATTVESKSARASPKKSPSSPRKSAASQPPKSPSATPAHYGSFTHTYTHRGRGVGGRRRTTGRENK